MLKPFFCRLGNKKWIKKEVINKFPENYKDMIYVEPFIGGGSIYLSKDKSKVEIINDLDNSLIEGYKLILKTDMKDIEKFRQKRSLEEYNDFVNSDYEDDLDKLVKHILIKNNTFMSKGIGKIYKDSNPYCKLKILNKYQERLKDTKIHNEDYKNIIKMYDSKNTFIYLDPPYEKSNGIYIHNKFDYIKLKNILENIKGKFLLSINDSENIRSIFKDFNITEIKVQIGHGHKGCFRDELLIKNY